MADNDTKWYCVDCSHVLGYVQGGEFSPAEDMPGPNLETQGPNLKVRCPECGRVKIWYTSDTIVRSIYQLINAISSEGAKRMIRDVSRADFS